MWSDTYFLAKVSQEKLSWGLIISLMIKNHNHTDGKEQEGLKTMRNVFQAYTR